MRFSVPVAIAPLVALSAATSTTYKPAATVDTDILAAKGLLNLAIYEVQQAFQGNQGSCTLGNVAIRREWGTLSTTERKRLDNLAT